MTGPSARDWLSDLEPIPGTTLVEHARSLLPESGRGPLPDGGEPLPDHRPAEPGKVRWSAGSLDGLKAVRGSSGDGNEPLAAAAALIGLFRTTPSPDAVRSAIGRLTEVNGPQQVDRLLAAALDGHLPMARLAVFARWLCVHGTRRELVKPAIALLGVSGDADDRDLILTLGLLEELTLYAAVALGNLLPEPEEAIFDLARQVEGWGRIHTVQRLKGSTDPRVQDWLLRGGAESGVMTEELAFIAATTGGLRAALEGDVDDDLLDHAGELLRALAMGGPAEDMSDYEDGAAAMRAYAAHARNLSPTTERLDHLLTLERYLEGWAEHNPFLSESERESLRTTLTALLDGPAWAAFVAEKLASDDIAEVKNVVAKAKRFSIDPRPVLRAWLPRTPHDSYVWQCLLTGSDTDDFRELLREAMVLLPLKTLDTGPADDLGLGMDYAAEYCLEIVIRRLVELPGEGWPLVRIALNNRVIRVRNVALMVLEAWPKDNWPEEAEDLLRAAFWREPRDSVRTTIRGLLDKS